MRRTLRWHDPERWLGWATVAVLVGLLEAAVRAGAVNRALVPAPSTVVHKLFALIGAGEVLRPLGETLALLALAYVGACAAAVAAGLLMGRFAWVHGPVGHWSGELGPPPTLVQAGLMAVLSRTA